jgi:hypothetical protein
MGGLANITHKTCSKCQETKGLESFSKNRSRPDGFRSSCKACDAISRKIYREKNLSKVRAASLNWYRENKERSNKNHIKWREENVEKSRSRNRAYRERNQDKVKCRNKTRAALKSGRLIKPPYCSINNSTCSKNLEVHHNDYRDPMNVFWLCKKHHVAWHRVFKPLEGKIRRKAI